MLISRMFLVSSTFHGLIPTPLLHQFSPCLLVSEIELLQRLGYRDLIHPSYFAGLIILILDELTSTVY